MCEGRLFQRKPGHISGVFLCPLDLTAEGESIKVAITALNMHGRRDKCLHLDSGRPVRANKYIQFHQKCFILKIQ